MIPTNRGMKGFTIIFGIYCTAFLLAYVLVSQLTQAHIRAEPDNPKNKDIQNKVDEFNEACLIVSGVFGILTIISFILKLRYKDV